MGNVTLKDRLAARERPSEMPLMHQDWKNLLFMHWEYDPEKIQATLPPGLFVDTFRGKGFITMNPFLMENVSIVNMPALPGFSSFIEVNVRTYVYDKNGVPGVWFYSLDLNSLIAANMAREVFSLPYFVAELQASQERKAITVEGKREGEPHAKMKFTYEPISEVWHEAQTSTLDFFLLERYALFSFAANQLNIGRVHHSPYPIGDVHVGEIQTNLLELHSFELSHMKPDHTHYSPKVSVDIFPLSKVR